LNNLQPPQSAKCKFQNAKKPSLHFALFPLHFESFLSLPLLMTRVFANHAHDALAPDNPAFAAYFANRRTNFHDLHFHSSVILSSALPLT
jgi:hypothetical protein